MHVEIHLEGQRLAKYIGPLVAVGGPVVIDHFGLPSDPNPMHDPWMKAVRDLRMPTNLFIKMSAAYRTGFDILDHGMFLMEHLPSDRAVWGSDWPHTQFEGSVDYDQTTPMKDRLQLNTDGAAVAALYGLSI